MSIILAFLALIVMIVLHEWGHFIAGRICKTPIHEFSIGMGPLIFQRKGKKETTFSLRAIPMGGYCAFDADDASGAVDSSLNKLPVYKRIFIFVAGPLMNIITAFLIYFSIALFMGFPTVVPVVDTVVEDSAAYGVLQEGDELIAVEGKEINNDVTLLSEYVNESNGEEITITVLRDGSEVDVEITPTYDEANQRYLMGISQQTEYENASFIESIKYGFTATAAAIVSTFQGIIGLVTGAYKVSDMSGIVGVVSVMSTYATPSTLSVFMSLCGLISANLGVMNLLPVPGLDGSKILFGIYEKIFRKPIPEKAEYYMTMCGMVLLIGLFIFITVSDVIKL